MTVYQFVATVVAVALALSAIMTGAWLIWRRSRNSGWVDATWTFGLGAVGIVWALLPSASSGALTSRQMLVALLVASWSLRLGLHIAQRTARIADDPRYAKLLRDWGAEAPRQMFWLLQKQALVSIPLAVSILVAAWNPAPGLRLQDWIGVLVLVVAIAGRACRIGSCGASAPILRTANASAMPACGVGPGTRITFSNGSVGWLIRCSPSTQAPTAVHTMAVPILGAGSLSPGRSACIGSWRTSPAFPRSKPTCWNGAASNTAPTRCGPMRFFQCRRGSVRS